MICFLRPASEKPPASPRSVNTSPRACSSSSDQAGRSVFAWRQKIKTEQLKVYFVFTSSPFLAMTTMGPRLPAMVSMMASV